MNIKFIKHTFIRTSFLRWVCEIFNSKPATRMSGWQWASCNCVLQLLLEFGQSLLDRYDSQITLLDGA